MIFLLNDHGQIMAVMQELSEEELGFLEIMEKNMWYNLSLTTEQMRKILKNKDAVKVGDIIVPLEDSGYVGDHEVLIINDRGVVADPMHKFSKHDAHWIGHRCYEIKAPSTSPVKKDRG